MSGRAVRSMLELRSMRVALRMSDNPVAGVLELGIRGSRKKRSRTGTLRDGSPLAWYPCSVDNEGEIGWSQLTAVGS